MMVEQRLWKKGDFVEMVDLARFDAPIEVPMPERWYMLRVYPNREFKVMKHFRRRAISAWLPMMTSTEDVARYRQGREYRSRRQVTYPMISGVIIIPDFEVSEGRFSRVREVEGVIGLYRMDQCAPFLNEKHMRDLRNIEATGNTPKSKRDHLFEIGELVRVTHGPFASFGARVERFDSNHRLRIGVEIFGRITPIDIDESDIEKI